MITVESKLELFNKVVLEKVQREQEMLLESFQERHESVLREQKIESTKKADLFLKAIIDEAYEEKKSMLARAKSDVKKKVLYQRQALIDHLSEAVLHRFESFTEEDAYRLYIKDLTGRYQEDLKEFGKFAVMLDSRHYERDISLVESHLKEVGLKADLFLESEEDIVGGCIFYNERRDILIDGSLVSLIEGHHREIGRRMYLMLNEVGGAYGDK